MGLYICSSPSPIPPATLGMARMEVVRTIGGALGGSAGLLNAGGAGRGAVRGAVAEARAWIEAEGTGRLGGGVQFRSHRVGGGDKKQHHGGVEWGPGEGAG